MDWQGDPRPEPPEESAPLRARSAAPGALIWIERNRPSHVLHVFAAACNLINDQDELLSLILDTGRMDPFTLALGRPADWRGFDVYLDADSPVKITSTGIEVGTLRVVIDNPLLWASQPDWRVIRAASKKTPDWISHIETQVLQNRSADSLASLIGNLDAAWTGGRSPWWTTAAASINTLLDGLASRDLEKLGRGAASLAGLGPGLTPSGDDFLIGLMYAIRATLTPDEADALCGVLVEAASPRTGVFPAAHIRAAGRGDSSEHWQALLAACTEGEAEEIHAAIDRLLAVGHTSGEDALAGFLLGAQRLYLFVD